MLATENKREDSSEAMLADISAFFAENGFVPTPNNICATRQTRVGLYADAKQMIEQWREKNPEAMTKAGQMEVKAQEARLATDNTLNKGFEQIQKEFMEGWEKCYKQGYSNGHKEGYKEAYEAAYTDAQAAFESAGNNDDEVSLTQYTEKLDLDNSKEKTQLAMNTMKLQLKAANNELAREKLLNAKLKKEIAKAKL